MEDVINDPLLLTGPSPQDIVLMVDEDVFLNSTPLLLQTCARTLKDEENVLYCLTGQDPAYISMGLRKMGIDADRALKEGELSIYEVLDFSEYYDLPSEANLKRTMSDNNDKEIVINVSGEIGEEQLSNRVLKFIEEFLQEREGMQNVVVFDDLSMWCALYGLGASIKLFQGIRKIINKYQESSCIFRLFESNDTSVKDPQEALLVSIFNIFLYLNSCKSFYI